MLSYTIDWNIIPILYTYIYHKYNLIFELSYKGLNFALMNNNQ